ncbi:hypothetical protein GCM10007103_09350 [Salinimicrobium marinum]|uniref:4-alpha-L-fucosyltransferase glycosyl transferase group 56 n=1 Tax=Salinimicrobium marinum TaxID=680283 RepID=A0A918VWJ1_9FLAO|nr:TDP-N-acetylfucosamine:lipid II N-acetylfucosaminyltransferase [Salinimicrobium marinum]GHA30172.1 hypothetical protein GCM10007103_09350 [Salinimicrobium marinum]
MKKLIHISTDEKFINSAYWQFNKCFPNNNVFYLLVDDVAKKIEYVNINDDFILVDKRASTFKNIIQEFKGDELIIFHGLSYFASLAANVIPAKYKKIWIVFGKEVYSNSLIFDPSDLHGPLTFKKFIEKDRSKNYETSIRRLPGKLYRRIMGQVLGKNEVILKAIRGMNYCGILYKEELNLIEKTTKAKLRHLKFSYYPIEAMLKDPVLRIESNNILIGNSASYTNNHLEVLKILSTFSLDRQKIIAPLSYGNRSYAMEITKKGKELFGNQFDSLMDFMPLHEYNHYISQCGIVIMNHYRQQAVGNVLTMLWMGAKVFLNEENTLYAYLKSLGIKIFSISMDLKPDNPGCLDLLPPSEQNRNRELLKKEISQEVLLKDLKCQIEKIMKDIYR